MPFTPSSHGAYREGCGTLRSKGGDLGGGSETLAIWRGGDQANAEHYENMAGTLNCNKGQQGGIVTQVVGTVTARKGRNGGSANDDVNAGHLICVNARQRPVSVSGKSSPLGAQDRGHAVAFDTAQITSKTNRSNPQVGDPCHTLHGSPTHHITTPMQVRRLTPRECERLQGMPDDHTRIPWRGKLAEDCPDTPRYKAIGNSMAVPVMRWIGERIQMVDALLK